MPCATLEAFMYFEAELIDSSAGMYGTALKLTLGREKRINQSWPSRTVQ